MYLNFSDNHGLLNLAYKIQHKGILEEIQQRYIRCKWQHLLP